MAPLNTGFSRNVQNRRKYGWEDPANIQLGQIAGLEVLRLSGDMRLWGRPEEKTRLLDTFDSALRGSSALLFNLRGVKRVDTMGIALMVELLNKCIARGIIIQTVMPAGVAGHALRLVRIFGRYREFPDELAALRTGATADSRQQVPDWSKQEKFMNIPSGPMALLVHDQSQDMVRLKKILQDLSVQLDEVPTTDAAIERLSQASPPEVIFMDVRRAEDALRLVSLALENANSTAVIAVSSPPARSSCDRAFDYAAFRFVAPPFERSQVAVLLGQAVQQTMVWRQQHFAEMLKQSQARVQALSHEESARSGCSQAEIDPRLSVDMN